MFAQVSINPDTISSASLSRVPIGSNLANASRTLSPVSGSLALDDATEILYLGAAGLWKAVGDILGPAVSTDNALVRFDGTTGKIIQNSSVTLSDTGDLAGVTTINGLPMPTTQIGDVRGPNSCANNEVPRYSGTTGKVISNSVITITDIGGINNVATINNQPVATGTNTGDVTLTAFGAAPNANGASLSGQALTLQPASATQPGGVSTISQAFAGTKDFSNGGISMSAAVGGLTNVLQGASGYYRTTASVPITWDPNSILYPAPIVSAIRCERIGNMIFIKVDRMVSSPSAADRLESNVGAVPAQFRPSVQRGCSGLAVIGNINYTLPFNVGPAYAILYPTGQLAFGPSQAFGTINPSGVLNDGVTLQPFSGPNDCGVLEQVLMFEA